MKYDYLKDEYLEARKENPNNTTYTFRQIAALRNMAEKDVYPDGRFGDDECNIWSMFSLLYANIKGN